MTRYDFPSGLTHFPEGRYVLYESAEKELAEKDKEIERLTESLLYYVKEAMKEQP